MQIDGHLDEELESRWNHLPIKKSLLGVKGVLLKALTKQEQ